MGKSVKQSAANEVFMDAHEVVHSIYHGQQTASGMQNTIDRILQFMEKLIGQNKPVRLLVDIRDMGQYDQSAKLTEMHARTILPFWKMAIVTTGKLPENEQISRKLTLMSGRRKEIRYFQREDDAVGWLSFMRLSATDENNSSTQKPAINAG